VEEFMNAQTPLAGQSVFVSFSAEIIPSTTEALIAAMAQCSNQGVSEVTLLLSTPGGSVMNGMNIYNVIKAMPFHLTTHNVGNVDSIGNAIFLAGDTRYAAPHSTFMFHGVGFDVDQRERFEEKLLRERLEGIMADQKRIGAIIEERTNLTPEQVKTLFLEATTKDAAYAASVGIVDEVRDVDIPAGSPIMSLVFQR
jgi:ATP-dependent Clp protease protease subunit